MKAIKVCLIAFGLLAVLAVGSLALYDQLQKKILNPRKSVLIQNYQIEANRDYTEVSATVSFRDFARSQDSFAQKVEFNGREMQNDFLVRPKEIDRGCPVIDTGLPVLQVMPLPTPTPRADKTVFSLVQEGYRKDNVVTIYDQSGNSQSYTISFEPLELAQPDSIVLSRSKDNVVKLKGGVKDKTPIFGISYQGASVDEKSFRYDKENNLLFVPAKSLKRLSKGKADFWIISGDSSQIKTPGLLTGNSYIISYNYMTCIQIVD